MEKKRDDERDYKRRGEERMLTISVLVKMALLRR